MRPDCVSDVLLVPGTCFGKSKKFPLVLDLTEEPASWNRSGNQLAVRGRPKTDFWRKTFYGYITDNGHFFHLSANGDFTFQARVNGQYGALYRFVRPGRTHGALGFRELDEVRDGVL